MTRGFALRSFGSLKQLIEDSLGPLEVKVLSLVFNDCGVTVRDVCDRLGPVVAYTTVMTTMDRLFRKGLLDRAKVGRAFVYRATTSRAELESAVGVDLLRHFLQSENRDPQIVLSSLVEGAWHADPHLLDELERLIQEKRAKLKDG
jgi:BlaI family transcriptional regulator, penicillinase repressor